MAVEDVTCGNENEARDSDATSTIASSEMESVEENSSYADRNGNANAARDENENKIRDSVSQCNIPCGKIEDKNLRNDNNVMQDELPEFMVFYEENDYRVVKDICIDKGVPLKDKIVIERENDDGLCTFLLFDENQNGDATKEREDSDLLSSNGSKSSSENDYKEDDIQEWGTKDYEVNMELLLEGALKSLLENHLVDDIGNDGGSFALVQTGEENYSATDKTVENVPREKSLKSLLESPYSDGTEVQWQSVKIPCSESECKAPSLVSTAAVPIKSSSVNDLSYDSNRDENSDDVAAPLKSDSEPASHEDAISDISAVGSEIQKSQGESSFSMAAPVSGLITYSGPMSYSGSVSLRSDSSTTSTRSFAFPM
ncbi:hypothetical protein RHGRI_033769 [Rhododendron griersonianum]|uniref:Uncharacterized protein n=1 Tax=Rhododendron griersonianum TaxID=479676 RepID=A0AAV6I3T1_9ERIC|nr:hypothetical protein RHGRI_033769 [Rhododendron griersonianum]